MRRRGGSARRRTGRARAVTSSASRRGPAPSESRDSRARTPITSSTTTRPSCPIGVDRVPHDEVNSCIAATKGTARNSTPGTNVAIVTGTHTCCDRRSMVSISSRCTSRRVARDSSVIESPEVARFPVEHEHGNQPSYGGHTAYDDPFLQRGVLAQAVTDPTAHAPEVGGARAVTASREPIERGADRVAGGQQHAELLRDHR